MPNRINPETGVPYPEQLSQIMIEAQEQKLDLTNTMLEVDVENNENLTSEEFALSRREGLGTSDAGIVLGVNPYETVAEMIATKISKGLTQKEKETALNPNVRKGTDLEPLIIYKHNQAFSTKTIKPVSQYRHKEHPWLKFNYDGVVGTPEQYLPAEIKVISYFGDKHYNFSKAMFIENKGFFSMPENAAIRNWSIQTKANHYGIPAYYYTQLQQQMLGFNAPYGYLTTLFEKDWILRSFFVWADETVQNAILIEGFKVWLKILALRGLTYDEWLRMQNVSGSGGSTPNDVKGTGIPGLETDRIL